MFHVRNQRQLLSIFGTLPSPLQKNRSPLISNRVDLNSVFRYLPAALDRRRRDTPPPHLGTKIGKNGPGRRGLGSLPLPWAHPSLSSGHQPTSLWGCVFLSKDTTTDPIPHSGGCLWPPRLGASGAAPPPPLCGEGARGGPGRWRDTGREGGVYDLFNAANC